MSKWLKAAQEAEPIQVPAKQPRKEKTDTSQLEKKLTLQLEARMREREASDVHFKSPSGHPV
eukprot:4419678-Pyramimonas_sp.AAC.1